MYRGKIVGIVGPDTSREVLGLMMAGVPDRRGDGRRHDHVGRRGGSRRACRRRERSSAKAARQGRRSMSADQGQPATGASSTSPGPTSPGRRAPAGPALVRCHASQALDLAEPVAGRRHHDRRVRAGVSGRRDPDDRLRHRGAEQPSPTSSPGPATRSAPRGRRSRARTAALIKGAIGGWDADHRDHGAGRPADLRRPRGRAGLPGRSVQHRRPGPGDLGRDPRPRTSASPSICRPSSMLIVAIAGGHHRRCALGRYRRLAEGQDRRPRGDRDDHDQLHRRRACWPIC